MQSYCAMSSQVVRCWEVEIMRWLLVILCVGVVAGTELHCDSPRCSVEIPDYEHWLKFYVAGGTVEMNYTESYFYVNCHKWQALDSPAMPHFTSEFTASTVVLASCPMPTSRNGSLVNALAALNVTLQPVSGEMYIKMLEFPSEPQLTPNHFIGLEHLTNISIKSYDTTPEPSTGFFAEFQNLSSLELSGVRLPAGELSRLPRTLKSLDLTKVSMELIPYTLPEALSETLRALPNLLDLTFQPESAPKLAANKPNVTKLQKNQSSSIESLSLYFWNEKRMSALEQCENLRRFSTSKAIILEELPDRFVAACPRLEELRVFIAPALSILPARLLEGAPALKSLALHSCKIESLPQGLFQDAPNLIEINLSNNRLQTLPSAIFHGLPLQSLSLRDNQLTNTALNELATLTSLTELNLRDNEFNDFCDDSNGYSSLSNLTQLRKLDLSHNDITRICRDWRENLTFLENLNLNSYGIQRLRPADFQYTRDASVKNSVVNFGECMARVQFTEDDYKNALTAPASGATLTFVKEFIFGINIFTMECDCHMYWLRRAMDSASHAIKIKGIVCSNNRLFQDMTPEEVCPERGSTKI